MKIGDNFVKDGEVVEVVWLNATCVCEYEKSGNEKMVWFERNNDMQKNKTRHVSTLSDFLEQYKPYEVCYEYQYAYIRINISASLTSHPFYYIDDEIEKFYEQCGCKDIVSYQRLDFTKRERVSNV